MHGGDFIILHLECTNLRRSFPFSFQFTCKKNKIIIFSKLIQLLYNVKYVYYIRYNIQILLHQWRTTSCTQ